MVQEESGDGTAAIFIDYKRVFKAIGAGHTNQDNEASAIYTNGRQFYASLDGQGAAVNIAMDNSYRTQQNGLFGYVYARDYQQPVIEKLTVTGSVKGSSYTGGLIGYTDKNKYIIRNVTIDDMAISGLNAGGLIGAIGYQASSLISSGAETIANIKDISVKDTAIDADINAGGLIGLAESSSLYVLNADVTAARISGGQNAGGAIGQVRFGRMSDTHDQTDFYQIYDSKFSGLDINSSAGSAGGVYGSYMVGASKLSQLHLVQIDATGKHSQSSLRITAWYGTGLVKCSKQLGCPHLRHIRH